MSTVRGKTLALPAASVGPNAVCKRVLDVLLAVLALTFTAPLFLLVAAVLWLEAPGHVLFAQRRLGLGGRVFTLYKFRKFAADCGSQGPGVTVANDVRMTKFGALLERSKLDELPQLWNILKGEMSFVGPRPESLRFADLFVGEARELLNHRPGLFGPAQIAFRNEGEMFPLDEPPEAFYRRELFYRKARLDLDYYLGGNCLSDLVWIVRGLWVSAVGAIPWRRLVWQNGSLIVADLGLTGLAWTLANVFRFRGLPPPGPDFDSFLQGLLLFPLLLVAVLLACRCYRYPKRYFSLVDVTRLVAFATLAWLLSFVVLLGLSRHASLYLVPMGWFVLIPFLVLPRAWLRTRAQATSQPDRRTAQILIYGPGAGGVALAHWVSHELANAAVLGFLDDRPENQGQRIHGFRVFGSERDLATILDLNQVDEIWLTFSPEGLKRHRLTAFVRERGVRLVVFPELEPFVRYAR